MIAHTKSFARKFQAEVGEAYEVRWGMRYGAPAMADVMKDWAPDELLIFPLYPQYAESSTRTGVEEALRFVSAKTKVKIQQDFFEHEAFIHSEAHQIQKHLDAFSPDHLLLSYHGLPEHHLQKIYPQHCLNDSACCEKIGDENRFCYRAQCFATTRALRSNLNFPAEKITLSFQSRLGRRPWIKPYTDFVVPELIAKGVRRLSVACPSFVSDCLETLEEIQLRLKEQFISEGGQDLALIPCLNDEDFWVANFRRIVESLERQK